jgi:hypothetical protein
MYVHKITVNIYQELSIPVLLGESHRRPPTSQSVDADANLVPLNMKQDANRYTATLGGGHISS